MPEKVEIDLYQFISREMEKQDTRIEKLMDKQDTRIEKLFQTLDTKIDKLEARMDSRFNKLEEEVRWPRRIAIGGVITTVLAVFVAIFGFRS
ncbi:hypothetical protein AGMMS4952_01680 [Spirochaetia bacterium]|nr:hypothetical protein AGMMS4952_01680 [Spirochaetia bacterium]